MITHTPRTIAPMPANKVHRGKEKFSNSFTWQQICKKLEELAANYNLTAIETSGQFEVHQDTISSYEDATVGLFWNATKQDGTTKRNGYIQDRYSDPIGNLSSCTKFLQKLCQMQSEGGHFFKF